MMGHRKAQGNMASIWKKNESIIVLFQENANFTPIFSKSFVRDCNDTYTKMHIRPQRAHERVEGPVFVCVVICSWQLKQVKLTGPSDNSVGTTSWVATEGGAVCLGPKSANWNV